MENWAKIFQKIFPKTCSKHVWILLGTIVGIFGILKIFRFFLKIFENSTFHGKVGKKFSKSLPQNLFKTRLDTFGNDFGRFWNFEIFLIFLKNFEDSTFHGKLGKFFSEKLSQITIKTRLDSFEEDFGRFWKFEIFFFGNFRRLDIPWKTGQKFFKKFSPKHVQNTFGYFWEQLWAFLEF